MGWEPEDPLLVQLHDARLARQDAMDDRERRKEASHTSRLQEAVASVLRAHEGDRMQTPQPLTLPEGVTTGQALQWIRGCERLGLLEPHPSGYLILPPGVVL